MHSKTFLKASILLLASTLSVHSQIKTSPPKPKRIPNFVDPVLFDLSLLLPPPPALDSVITRAELAAAHEIEQTRTPAQVSAAQFDDKHEDIFIYASVLGPDFAADSLPLTAVLSAHIRNDSGVVDPPLKTLYARPRPYNFDTTLHPVCDTNKEGSYPSGHALNGFLYAYTLTQIVPEKHAEILARADDYAHSRIICGVHYPTDIEASRRAASILFGYMLATPRFQRELALARQETRHRLNLP